MKKIIFTAALAFCAAFAQAQSGELELATIKLETTVSARFAIE